MCLKDATEGDAPVILAALRGLADDLNMAADCAATEGSVRRALAGDYPSIEALIARVRNGLGGGRGLLPNSFSHARAARSVP